MKEKRKIILAVLGILLLVLATVGVTFAVFTYTKLGTTENTVTTGTLKFLYTENTGVGNGINIENAFPVSDEVGKGYNTDKYVFDFSVESTNSGTEEIPYEVTLRKKSTSTLSESNIKVYLTDMTDEADTAIVSPTLYSDLTQTTIDVEDEVEKTIYNGTVLGGELTYKKDFRLRMWIDEKSNQDDINGKTFTALVNVYSNVPLVSEEEINLRESTDIVSIETGTTNATEVIGKDYQYEMIVPEGTTEVTLDITTKSSKAIVEIEKLDSLSYSTNIRRIASSKKLSLTNGDNYFKITVTSQNKLKIEDYILKISVIKEPYKDESGANVPVVSTGMIPVIYKDDNWVKADISEKWYDYNTQMWANAVTVSETNRDTYMKADAGTPISMSDINTMWVWIPRYEYETITSTTATEIKVKFLKGTESNKTSNYITHPAFTFGDKSLTGIWVAKFEASSDKSCTVVDFAENIGCDITTLKVNIKPNVTSWRGIRLSTLDLTSRSMNYDNNIYGFIKTEVDTHAMKNLEWGAVAYLSQSKYGKYGNPNYEGPNKEIYQNKSSEFITGMSNGTASTNTTNTQVAYNVEKTGTGASTTGTIYGIYDMSGGAWEYVMGVIKGYNSNNPMSGVSDTHNSGFEGQVYNSNNYKDISGRSWPNSKFYDLYEFGTTYNDDTAYRRYKTGDATTETKTWNGDYTAFANVEVTSFMRGGCYNNDTNAGIFSFNRTNGVTYNTNSFRPVLVEN